MTDTPEPEHTHWKDQEECQGCGADKPRIGQDGGAPVRAIQLKSGRKDLLCSDCFAEAVTEGRVSRNDPRVADDGTVDRGTHRAPGQRGGCRD